MPSLDERFERLAHVRSPDLWTEIETREPRPSPPEPRWRSALAVVVAFAVAIAGIGLAVWAFRDPREDGHRPVGPVTSNGMIAYVVREERAPSAPSAIYGIAPDGSGVRRLTPDGPLIGSPAWSPDGLQVAYASDGGIAVMDADGTKVATIVIEGSDPTWSPDGTRLAFTCGGAICLTPSDGTDVTQLTHPRPALDAAPAWSPDGEWIVFTRSFLDPTQEDVTHLFAARTDGTRLIDLATVLGFTEAAWSPDGSRIAFAGRVDPSERSWEIFVMNADGTGRTRLTRDDATDSAPAWSPDGSQIAFSRAAGNGDADIFVISSDGTDLTRVTSDPADEIDPAWQPITEVSPTAAPSVPPEPGPVELRVSTIDGVAAFPSAVAVGEGGVWVTSCCGDSPSGDEVIRLDPSSGDVLARIGVRAPPGSEFGGAGLAVGDGSVWTVGGVRSDRGCCDALVTRFDPATNAVVDEIRIPGLTGGDIWVDGSTLYVLGFTSGAGGSSSQLEVARVDPETHAISWQVPVPGQWSQTVFASGGWVWVLGTAPDARGPIEVTTLYRLDPGSGDIVETISEPGTIGLVPVVYPDSVWFRTESGVQRFDPISGSLVGDPLPLEPGCCGGPFVPDGEGGIWVVSSAGAGAELSVWHVDASGVVVGTSGIEDPSTFEQIQGQSYAFDPETQSIWVQHYKDSIARIELISDP